MQSRRRRAAHACSGKKKEKQEKAKEKAEKSSEREKQRKPRKAEKEESEKKEIAKTIIKRQKKETKKKNALLTSNPLTNQLPRRRALRMTSVFFGKPKPLAKTIKWS